MQLLPTSECTTWITSNPATIQLRSLALKICKGNPGAKRKLVTDTIMATALVPADDFTHATYTKTQLMSNLTAPKENPKNKPCCFLHGFQ
jgi:hypothetical protein